MRDSVFQEHPFGLLLADPHGTILDWNAAAERLLGAAALPPAGRPRCCCDVLGCRRPGTPLEHGCLSELALSAGEPLPEVRVDLPAGGEGEAAWVTASTMSEGSGVLIHLRPGTRADRRRRTQPHWISGPRLHIRVLGELAVSSDEGPIGGGWLAGRPGELLRFLVAERRRAVLAEEIAATVWQQRDPATARNVRHCVHTLREQLEPERPKRGGSSFVMSRAGGYALDLAHADVDADEFEREARAGLDAFERGDIEAATGRLEEAIGLYRGDFLADAPYAVWALSERERLRELACAALRALGEIALQAGDLYEASRHFDRLAEMQPFDDDVQRMHIALALCRGRRTLARRRYNALRLRMRQEFRGEPGFDLEDIVDILADAALVEPRELRASRS